MVVWNDFQTTFFLYKNRCPDNSDNDKDTYNVASRSPHETSNPDVGHVRYAQTLGTGSRLDNRRRRKPPANPLLPLRPNRHLERDDR